jgi:isopenicillin N synthase-like dioxygenase
MGANGTQTAEREAAAGVPVVDIAGLMAGRPEPSLAAVVDHALQTSGFLLVTGHGVDASVPIELRRLAREFYAQPADVKREVFVPGKPRGWVPPASMANAVSYGIQTAPDLHESLMFGRERPPELDPTGSFPANPWPAHPPELRPIVESYIDSMYSVAASMMALLAGSLGLDATYFDPHLVNAVGSFGLHWYPSLHHVGEVVEDQYRIGPHTDFGALTLLDRERAVSGLQIQTAEGEWVDAPYVPGALTVNIGDLMARWTGDRWRSTRHRVLAPAASAPDEEIVSLVFFYDVDPATLVETLPPPACGPRTYQPVIAGDYIDSKLKSILVP